MKKLKLAVDNNDLNLYKNLSESMYLNDNEIISLLKKTITSKKLDFFDYTMRQFLTPEVFWQTHKHLVKNNEYDFLKLMININRDKEPNLNKKNSYANELLFDFLKKDDLYFVSYLVEKEQASTENIVECDLSVLNECAKSNAIKCFDYFLSRGHNVHDFEDLALFNALENKNYHIVNLIISADNNIDKQIAEYFFRYGVPGNAQSMNTKDFLQLIIVAQPAIDKNPTLQNSLNYEHIKRGNFKQLELNLQKGHSPIGDDKHDLMGLAIMLRNNAIKTIKLLLDYGGVMNQEHKDKLSIDEAEKIQNYPRFSKIKQKLENKMPLKGKEKTRKI